MSAILKKLGEYLLRWIFDPKNIKAVIKFVIEYVSRRAADPKDDFFDTLDKWAKYIGELIKEIMKENAEKAAVKK
jgi:dissimilatory sulfite reductase (desulfoviridin) alpha/beta subunit